MQFINVPKKEAAQYILQFFKKKAKDKSELERIKLAKRFLQSMEKRKN